MFRVIRGRKWTFRGSIKAEPDPCFRASNESSTLTDYWKRRCRDEENHDPVPCNGLRRSGTVRPGGRRQRLRWKPPPHDRRADGRPGHRRPERRHPDPVPGCQLPNLKPEGFVAVFGLADEGATVPDGQTRLDGRIGGFLAALKELGIQDGDLFVDYISQNRVYDYALTGNTAREKLSGFEVKKNIAIRYQDRALLDKMLAAAARFSIFDLVKVDYLTAKPFEVRHRLMEAASKVISQKKDDYAAFFGIKPAPQRSSRKNSMSSAAEQYNSYTAYDAGSVSGDNDVRVVEKRKTSTFYYNPLHPGEFDLIIDPVVTEPVIQYSLYLKIACRPEP